jgi:hypothetical protein
VFITSRGNWQHRFHCSRGSVLRTRRIEIGTAVIDMRYENPHYMAEDAGAADVIAGGRLQLGISRGSPEQVIDGWRHFGTSRLKASTMQTWAGATPKSFSNEPGPAEQQRERKESWQAEAAQRIRQPRAKRAQGSKGSVRTSPHPSTTRPPLLRPAMHCPLLAAPPVRQPLYCSPTLQENHCREATRSIKLEKHVVHETDAGNDHDTT